MAKAFTCSACVAAQVQRPAVSYPGQVAGFPKHPWARWWTDGADPGWVCTQCWSTRELEELEALLGEPHKVGDDGLFLAHSPLTPSTQVPDGEQHFHSWPRFRSAVHGSQQALRRRESDDDAQHEPFNAHFPEAGHCDSRTCQACIMDGARPPNGRAARAESLLRDGWARWETTASPWVCADCWSRRDFHELADLLQLPQSVTTKAGTITGPEYADDDPRVRHCSSPDSFAAAVDAERLATKVDRKQDTDVVQGKRQDRQTEPYASPNEPVEQVAHKYAGVDVGELVGEGASGSVFRAHDNGKLRALKVLKPKLFGDPNASERFFRESEIAEKLDHPNLVKLYKHVLNTKIQYILMEFVDGITLRELLQNASVEYPAACRYVEQACAGLHHAHERGLVHRDVKPENLFVSAEDGTIKVGDFGIAKTPDFYTLTQQGEVMGTPAYMAPEQEHEAHEVDRRADVYSLGIVLYELVTGRRPRREPGTGRMLLDAINPQIDAVLAKAANVDPKLRYLSAEALRKAIVAARLARG
jgi:tRNA A-37 threonylcarbamoyl transferase component Bud32